MSLQLLNTEVKVTARVRPEQFQGIVLNVIKGERTLEGMHPEIIETHAREGFAERPKSKQELVQRITDMQDAGAAAEEIETVRKQGFNGLSSSIVGGFIVDADLRLRATAQATRYLVGRACSKAVSDGLIQRHEAELHSPNMLNVSAVAVVKKDGKYFLLSQIKGDALGSGQIHGAICAGGVDGKALLEDDPLAHALQNEAIEELGIQLSGITSEDFCFLIGEDQIGMVNAGCVVAVDYEEVFFNFSQNINDAYLNNEKPEVAGLSLLGIPKGLVLFPLEGGGNAIERAECLLPKFTSGGVSLEQSSQTRGVRPYTLAMARMFADRETTKKIIERAGHSYT